MSPEQTLLSSVRNDRLRFDDVFNIADSDKEDILDLMRSANSNANLDDLIDFIGDSVQAGLVFTKTQAFRYKNEIVLRVSNQYFSAERELDFENKVISNIHLYSGTNFGFKNPDDGFGIKAFVSQVEKARYYGFEKLKTNAYRSDPNWVGYYVWPRFGYSFEKNKEFIKFAEKHNRKEKNISDMFLEKEGREYWKKHGDSFDAVFNLNLKSNNSRFLRKYLKEKQ